MPDLRTGTMDLNGATDHIVCKLRQSLGIHGPQQCKPLAEIHVR